MHSHSASAYTARLAWPFGRRNTRLPARPMHAPSAPALLWRSLSASLHPAWWAARPLAA
jgi:hypothetical protein